MDQHLIIDDYKKGLHIKELSCSPTMESQPERSAAVRKSSVSSDPSPKNSPASYGSPMVRVPSSESVGTAFTDDTIGFSDSGSGFNTSNGNYFTNEVDIQAKLQELLAEDQLSEDEEDESEDEEEEDINENAGQGPAYGEKLFWDGKYVGHLHNGKKQGVGTMTYFTGERYEGYWKNDVWEGEGAYYWKNGDKYYGSFHQMKRNGYGKLILHTGNYYEGEFKDDKMNGTGIYKWVNKDLYEGTFRDGMRDGFGTMIWHDGQKYTGGWRLNKRHGAAEYYSAEGTKKYGVWKEGVLSQEISFEQLYLDRLFRNTKRYLTTTEENYLYFSLLQLNYEKAIELINLLDKEINSKEGTKEKEKESPAAQHNNNNQYDSHGLAVKENQASFTNYAQFGKLKYEKSAVNANVKISAHSFNFRNKKCFTFKTMHEKIEIKNEGDQPILINLNTYSKRNYNIAFTPGKKVIQPKKSLKVKVSVTPIKPCTVSDIIILDFQTKKDLARHIMYLTFKSEEVITNYKEFNYDEISTGKLIGQGSFGVVHLVDYQGMQLAVKEFIIDLKQMLAEDAEIALTQFRAEITLASMLNHDNVVKFLGACTKFPHLCLVMEYVPMKGLDKVLADESSHVSLRLAVNFLWDISKGLEYLHRCNVIHRDIKSQNLLVVSLSEEGPVNIKVADFGISRVLDRTRTGFIRTMTNGVGTLLWSAPEVVNREKYTEKADVYSFGVVMWEILHRSLTGKYMAPYSDVANMADVKKAIQNGDHLKIPSNCPTELKQIMLECWIKDFTKRPSLAEITTRIDHFRLKLRPSS